MMKTKIQSDKPAVVRVVDDALLGEGLWELDRAVKQVRGLLNLFLEKLERLEDDEVVSDCMALEGPAVAGLVAADEKIRQAVRPAATRGERAG